MARWFTSDWHLGHSNIMRYEPESRPFSSVDEMNEAIIASHNAVVAPDDIVIVLGDVAMGKISESLPLVGRMNGKKLLISGNHDRVFSGTKPGQREKFTEAYEAVFNVIMPEQNTTVLADGSIVNLCHFPYEGDHTAEDRYSDKRPFDNGYPLIHGHVHSLFKTRGRMFNVGIDANGLSPVSEDEIIAWIATL